MIDQKRDRECDSVLSSSEWVVAPGSVNLHIHKKTKASRQNSDWWSNWRLESPPSKRKSPEQELYLVFRNWNVLKGVYPPLYDLLDLSMTCFPVPEPEEGNT